MEKESKNMKFDLENVGIVQSLADHDPDIDALYRLTQPLPVFFRDSVNEMVAMPSGVTCPWNAQATLFTPRMLWGLLLPVTVHGRVSDIWRSFLLQRLMWDLPAHVVFTKPVVTQYRNLHNYLADFNSEIPLYEQAGELVRFITAWQPRAATLAGRIEELIIALYERNLVEACDVRLAQAWLSDLAHVQYALPALAPAKQQFDLKKAPKAIQATLKESNERSVSNLDVDAEDGSKWYAYYIYIFLFIYLFYFKFFFEQ